MDQRHVAAAGIDQGLQVGVAPMAAGLAPHQHADLTTRPALLERALTGSGGFVLLLRYINIAASARRCDLSNTALPFCNALVRIIALTVS